jgi:hypothetical protein
VGGGGGRVEPAESTRWASREGGFADVNTPADLPQQKDATKGMPQRVAQLQVAVQG